MTDASTTGADERLIGQLKSGIDNCDYDERGLELGGVVCTMNEAADTLRALVAERDAAIQRAEAAEEEAELQKTAAAVWQQAALKRQAALTEARAKAALAWEAGRDAAEQSAYEADSLELALYGETKIAERIRALTPPADLSAALTARLDAEWNAAIEAAAGKLSSNAEVITEKYGAVLLRTYAAAIRALRRAAPTEDR